MACIELKLSIKGYINLKVRLNGFMCRIVFIWLVVNHQKWPMSFQKYESNQSMQKESSQIRGTSLHA